MSLENFPFMTGYAIIHLISRKDYPPSEVETVLVYPDKETALLEALRYGLSVGVCTDKDLNEKGFWSYYDQLSQGHTIADKNGVHNILVKRIFSV